MIVSIVSEVCLYPCIALSFNISKFNICSLYLFTTVMANLTDTSINLSLALGNPNQNWSLNANHWQSLTVIYFNKNQINNKNYKIFITIVLHKANSGFANHPNTPLVLKEYTILLPCYLQYIHVFFRWDFSSGCRQETPWTDGQSTTGLFTVQIL